MVRCPWGVPRGCVGLLVTHSAGLPLWRWAPAIALCADERIIRAAIPQIGLVDAVVVSSLEKSANDQTPILQDEAPGKSDPHKQAVITPAIDRDHVTLYEG